MERPISRCEAYSDLRPRLRLMLVTDDAGRPAGELARIVAAAAAGGATAVQYREKSAPARSIVPALEALAPVCRDTGALLLLNAGLLAVLSADLASLDAAWGLVDGAHFGAATWPDFGLVPPAAARASVATGAVSGYSAHELDEAAWAVAGGADYVTLSPIFDTPSKRGILAPRGCGWLAGARAALGQDAVMVALGGMDATNAAQACAAGADGVAVMRAIMSADSPRDAARELRREVDAGLRRR